MPYITQSDRDLLDDHISNIVVVLKKQAHWTVGGMLNYVITKITFSLWNNYRNYYMGNTIVGALKCASSEFIHRKLNPYEEEKIKENGNVYPF